MTVTVTYKQDKIKGWLLTNFDNIEAVCERDDYIELAKNKDRLGIHDVTRVPKKVIHDIQIQIEKGE